MYDAIILGTGGVGSAALMQLARRGWRVLGIDRFLPGHDRGSSHGETRIIRKAYFEHSDYVPLLHRAYELWAELEAHAQQKLFHRVGLLQVGPPQGAVVQGVLHSAREHDLKVEFIENAAHSRSRCLQGFTIPEGMSAVFEEDAGYLLVEDCVVAHARAAIAAGAELHCGEAVQRWEIDGGGVRVITDRGVYSAGKLIVTAGAWARDLLSELDIPLRVVRKHLHWFSNYSFERTLPASTFLFEMPYGVFYGFPTVAGEGIKIAEHSGGTTVADPLTDPADADEADLAQLRRFIADCLLQVGHVSLRHARCFYTLSPDEHFLLDVHPHHPQISFAAGLSGHGFKFTPVLGEALADLATEGKTKLPIGFLGLGRFKASC
jgi:monomeric sarcosine oxidase